MMDVTSPESVPAAHDLNTLSLEHEINIPESPRISENGPIDDLSISGHKIVNTGASTKAQTPPHHGVSTKAQSPPRRRACEDLINGSTEDYMNICVPLHEAASTGNWEAAKAIFDRDPKLVRFAINEDGDTPLHVAVSTRPTRVVEKFVENLLDLLEISDLEIQNNVSDNAFHAVAANGSVKMLELMLNKHKTILLNLSPEIIWTGLGVSTDYGNHEMALYLYYFPEQKRLQWSWTDFHRCLFFIYCINADMLDIALELVSTDNLKISRSINTWTASLEFLARRPVTFNTTDTETCSIWRITQSFLALFHLKKGFDDMDNNASKLLKSILKFYPKSDIPDEIIRFYPFPITKEMTDEGKRSTLDDIILLATEAGNTVFVAELLKTFPSLVWAGTDDKPSIFHVAVMHRHIGIYNLLYELGAKRDLLLMFTDNMDNNILHLVGKTSNDKQYTTASGASILMQRELLWFKEVEKIIPPQIRFQTNKDSKTPYQLFSENNRDLVSKGLQWTKDCMVVSTLIIAIAFAAALTVPGGYRQEIGIPILTNEKSYVIFIIADAISLFSSSTSLLVFLSIITSPYGQRDFLYSLPNKLMIGLLTLFISVAAMMVTFGASFFVLYDKTFEWLPIIISIFAAMPVVVFATLQYPLLMDMFRSTYDSKYLFKPKRRVLYNRGERL